MRQISKVRVYRAVSILLLSVLLVHAADFGVPYAVDFTDSSGRTLFAGGGIAATSKNSDSVDLWSIGLGGVLVNAGSWTTAHGWSKTSPFSPFATTGQFKPGGGIAAVVRVPNTNTVDTFVLGDKGYLWNAGSFDGTNWHPPYQTQPWTSLPANSFIKGGGLAVNSRLTTLTDAFTIANDGCLWYAGGWDSAHGFKAPFKWPNAAPCVFVPGGGIAVNSRTSGMNDTWVIGRDGYLWNAGSFDGSFHAPYPHPNRLPHPFSEGAPVAAISRDSTRVDVYAFDPDGSLWMVGGYVNGSPVAPYRVPTSTPGSFYAAQGGANGLPLGGIAATSRSAGIADTWAIAPDGSAWNAGYWIQTGIPAPATGGCTHLPIPAHATLKPAQMPPKVAYTRRLGRLTSGPQTNAAAADVSGVDLGAAVEAPGGNLSFLFGDTRLATTEGNGVDALAVTAAQSVDRDHMPSLAYFTTGGRLNPFTIAGRDQIDLAINNTPQDGVPLPGGRQVVFAGTGSELAGRTHSTMAVTAAMQFPPSPLLLLNHVVKSPHFIYVSTLYNPDDGFVYIFGTGPGFRQSDWVHLARASANCVGDRSSWTYFTGNAKSTFEFGEANAQPIFSGPNPGLGELSVRKIGSGYVMLYQSAPTPAVPNVDRGVFARFAATPAGYWSAPVRIWAPGPVGGLFAAVGYGTSMHFGTRVLKGLAYDDGLAEPNATLNPPVDRHEEWGGEYAPELIPRWSDSAHGTTMLTFGLSLWNPYEADVFQSVLIDGTAAAPPVLPTGPLPEQRLTNPQFQGSAPLQGWRLSGGPFTAIDQCKAHFLSTYGPRGAGTMGSLQQTFVPGIHTTKLCASILGGQFNTPQFGSIEPNVSLRLLHNGAIVRETRPVSNKSDPTACTAPSESPVLVGWDLTEFVGESVTLEIHDSRQDSLGFFLISGLQQGAAISAAGRCQ
jgi:hypothetical protein